MNDFLFILKWYFFGRLKVGRKSRKIKALADFNNALGFLQKGSLVIDAGANVGEFTKLFLDKGFKVHAFEPDIIALAKGLGGGFPVGAVMAKAEVGDAMVPGTHGSTFGGNPLAMRSANAVLDLLLEDGFLQSLRDTIRYFDNKMDELILNDKNNFSVIVRKKGSGMLRGFELNKNYTAADFGNIAREKGLLLVGAAENTIRLLPPLNTSKEEINMAFELLNQVILEIKKK